MAATGGDFVLEVAELGKTLMTAFAKFLAYRKISDHGLENLYSTISISTGALQDLGSALKRYEDVFPVKDSIIRPGVEACKVNFEKLLVLMNEGVGKGVWNNDGTVGGKLVTAEVDPWFLMTLGLGGRPEANAFWDAVDESRATVVELKDTVKYAVLKDLSKK